jgi:ribonuclease J
MSNQVRITSLGGLTAIGAKNSYIIDYKSVGIILDTGIEIIQDDDSDRLAAYNRGPAYTEIPDDVKKIVGVFISHDHMDHVGDINGFVKFHETSLRFRDNPLPLVFTSRYCAGMIRSREYRSIYRNRLKPEHSIAAHPKFGICEDFIEVVRHGDKLFYDISAGVWTDTQPQGEHFALKFFEVPHSVAHSLGIVVEVGEKRIVYTGDVRMHGMTKTETNNFQNTLKDPELQRADLLMLDSTLADKSGEGKDEEEVVANLLDIFNQNMSGRVFVAAFGSLKRIHEILLRLKEDSNDRPVILFGGTMQDHMRYGHINKPLPQNAKFRAGSWKPYEYGKNEVPDNAIIFLTGSQGEPMASLTRLLSKKYNRKMMDIHIRQHDVVVFATRAIPGNEDRVEETLRELSRIPCMVYYPVNHDGSEPAWTLKAGGSVIRFADLHVSGHAPQEDLRKIVKLLKPKKVMPIHADIFQRAKMAELFRGRRIKFHLPMEHEPVFL